MENQSAASIEAVDPELKVDHRARMAAFGAILLTMFLGSLDQTVVGTALPRIVTDLHGSDLYAWVVTSYLLGATITGPIYGKFSDVFGRKAMLLIGVSVFLAGSWLSGLSQNMTELVLFRGLQGLGAGALFPVSMAAIGALFTPQERGKYQGMFGAVFGLSFIVGPFVGGWITDNISWHWVFYVNVPVGIAALFVLATTLPSLDHPQASARDLDYLGIVLFTVGLVPFLLGLTNKTELQSNGQAYGWTDPHVGGLILFGLLFIVAFLAWETRAKEPILPLDLFRSRDYAASMAGVFFFAVSMFGAVIYLPRYYQTVRGISATASGYYIWPLLVGLIGGSIVSGRIISRTGRYKWLMVASTAPLFVGAYLMTTITATSSDWMLWLAMFLTGIGLGPSMAGFTVVVQNSIPINRLGVGTSTLTFLRQVGASTGLAIANTMFLSFFTNQLPRSLSAAGVPAPIGDRISQHSDALQGVGDLGRVVGHLLPPPLQPLVPRIVTGTHDAFALAVGEMFWLALVSGVLALAACLLLGNRHLQRLRPEAAP